MWGELGSLGGGCGAIGLRCVACGVDARRGGSLRGGGGCGGRPATLRRPSGGLGGLWLRGGAWGLCMRCWDSWLLSRGPPVALIEDILVCTPHKRLNPPIRLTWVDLLVDFGSVRGQEVIHTVLEAGQCCSV